VFFDNHGHESLQAAAQTVLQANSVFVLGVGIANVFAKNFAYIASMARDNVIELPKEGALPIDGMARAKVEDVLLAVTFKPYRREVVEAVVEAYKQGVTVIGISDSPARHTCLLLSTALLCLQKCHSALLLQWPLWHLWKLWQPILLLLVTVTW